MSLILLWSRIDAKAQLGKAAIFPQDAQGEPMTSSDGQYEVKLFLNGAKRTARST